MARVGGMLSMKGRPLPQFKTHGSSTKGRCLGGLRPGHPLPLGWLSPSSPSLWDQAQRVGSPQARHSSPSHLWAGASCGPSQGSQVSCLQKGGKKRHISFTPHKNPGGGRKLFPILQMEKLRLGGAGTWPKPQTTYVMKMKLTPEPLPYALPLLLSWSSSTLPPPTRYIHKQDSPSLDTCQNSKATLKAWATVRVTAWA